MFKLFEYKVHLIQLLRIRIYLCKVELCASILVCPADLKDSVLGKLTNPTTLLEIMKK